VNEVKAPLPFKTRRSRLRELEGALRGQRARAIETALVIGGDGKQHQHGVARELEDVSIISRDDSYGSRVDLVDVAFQRVDAQ
jgi:hypothetical protein